MADPHGILIVVIWFTIHLVSEDVEILVDCQGVIGIACGRKIDYWTKLHIQIAQGEKWVSENVLSKFSHQFKEITAIGHIGENPALVVKYCSMISFFSSFWSIPRGKPLLQMNPMICLTTNQNYCCTHHNEPVGNKKWIRGWQGKWRIPFTKLKTHIFNADIFYLELWPVIQIYTGIFFIRAKILCKASAVHLRKLTLNVLIHPHTSSRDSSKAKTITLHFKGLDLLLLYLGR